MKMTSKNVSLPADLAAWAESEVRARSYPSFSAFIQDAIRSARDAAIAKDVALLEANAGPTGEPDEKVMAELHRDIRQHRATK